jgi:hypothetical protein
LRAEPPDLTLAPLDPGGEGETVAVLGGEEQLGQFVDAGTSGGELLKPWELRKLIT